MAHSNWTICVVSIKLYIRNGAGDGVQGGRQGEKVTKNVLPVFYY